MIILNEKIDKTDLQHAVNAELHADLEQLLLENGSAQSSLYGWVPTGRQVCCRPGSKGKN